MPDIFDRVLELNRLTYPSAANQAVMRGSTLCIRTGVFTVSRMRDCESPLEWQRKISPTRNSSAPSWARMVRHENERISGRLGRVHVAVLSN